MKSTKGQQSHRQMEAIPVNEIAQAILLDT